MPQFEINIIDVVAKIGCTTINFKFKNIFNSKGFLFLFAIATTFSSLSTLQTCLSNITFIFFYVTLDTEKKNSCQIWHKQYISKFILYFLVINKIITSHYSNFSSKQIYFRFCNFTATLIGSSSTLLDEKYLSELIICSETPESTNDDI